MGLSRATTTGLAARLFAPGTPQSLWLLRAAWPRAVGTELARRTEILAVEGTTLRVRVPDARWRKVLHRMQREILVHLSHIAGDRLTPQRMSFTEGPLAAPEAAPAPPVAEAAGPPPVAPASIVSEAQAIADTEIRERFLRTAASYLARRR